MPWTTSKNVAVILLTVLLFLMHALTTQRAMAGPVGEPGLLDVSTSLGSHFAREAEASSHSHGDWFGAASGLLDQDRGAVEIPLPDSLHFNGLAGSLNLVIDDSGKSVLVDGIELAPREILRFVAGGVEQIRGFHGQISIRLDF